MTKSNNDFIIKGTELSSMLLKHFVISFIFTIAEFTIIYNIFGLYFESYESVFSYIIKAGLIDSSTPFRFDAHSFTLPYLRLIKSSFLSIPIYSIYCIIFLFISIWFLNYFLLSKKNISITSKLFLHVLTFMLLFDNIVNVNNSRISILLLTVYTVFLHKTNSVSTHIISLFFLLFACIFRVEYGIIYSFILILYFILIKPQIKLYQIITTIILSSIFFTYLLWSIEHYNKYAKATFLLEREYLDKGNIKILDTNDQFLKKKIIFQKALFHFIEDRDNIKPEDYYNQLEYNSLNEYLKDFQWVSIYIERLKNFIERIFSEFQYHLLIITISLLIVIRWKSRKELFFIILVIIIPFIIMFQSAMPPRFYIPYTVSFSIICMVLNIDYLRSMKWIFVIIISFIFISFIIRDRDQVIAKYEGRHQVFIKLNSYYKEKRRLGKKVVHTSFHSGLVTPQVFYQVKIEAPYYIHLSFLHYFNSFRLRKSNIFKKPTCLYSNLKDIEKDTNLILVSQDSYMNFLKEYVHYFHNKELQYNSIDSITKNIKSYKIHLY